MREYDNLSDFDYNDYETRGFGGGSFAALLVGVGVGAALAMLFAPQSGVETRDLLRRRYRDTLDNLGERASDLRQRGAEIGEKVKPFARKVAEATGQGERFEQMAGGGTNTATGTTGTGNIGGGTGNIGGSTGSGSLGGTRTGGTGTTGGTRGGGDTNL